MMTMTNATSQSNGTMKWHATHKQSSLAAGEIAIFSRNVFIVGDNADDVSNENHGGYL